MFVKIIETDSKTVHLYEGVHVKWTEAEIKATPAATDGRTWIGGFSTEKEQGLYIDISNKERTFEKLTVVSSIVFLMSDTGQTIDRWSPRNMILGQGV